MEKPMIQYPLQYQTELYKRNMRLFDVVLDKLMKNDEDTTQEEKDAIGDWLSINLTISLTAEVKIIDE